MADDHATSGDHYDSSKDGKRDMPVGITKTDVDAPAAGASDDDGLGSKPQEDLTADDLKGFVKDPLEQ